MNAENPELLEEHYLAVLTACDEALAAGEHSTSLRDSAITPELRPRLEGDLACLQRLQRLRPAPSAEGGGRSAELAAPTHLGRFEIRRELGRGGFGVVFLAYDPLLSREVALKVPRVDALVTPELRARFHQEARTAAGLDHPNLVPVYEAGEVGPICYIASAYCPGVTLAQRLKELAEPMPAREAAELVALLADAVQHAHSRGVLHRDLKPGNVLLAVTSEQKSVIGHADEPDHRSPITDHIAPKITDFGLAKVLENEAAQSTAEYQTHPDAVLGTPSYMAPEQAAAKSKEISTAVDVYALGAILHELLTGRPPFQGESPLETLEQVRSQEPASPRRLRPGLPRDLETICLKCLRKEPGRRYASAHALAEDLKRFLAGEPIQARPVSPWERGVKWARRRPALAGLVSVSIAAVLTLGVGSLWYNAQLQNALQTATERGIEAQDKHAKARANFLKARNAVDKMLTEVAEVNLAHVPQMDQVRRKLLLEALAFYQEFLAEETDDPILRRETGRAYDRVALIHSRLGHHADAEEAYHHAQELHEKLAEEFPDDRQHQRDLAASRGNLGLLLRLQGRLVEAEPVCRQVLSAYEELAAEFPDNHEDRWSAAKSHNGLAQVLERLGHPQEAEKAYARSLAVYDELVEKFPNQTEVRLDRAGAQINFGILLVKSNRLEEAQQRYEAALGSLEKWAGSAGDLAPYRGYLAKGYDNLGQLLKRTGRLPQAEQAYRQAAAAGERLTTDFPAVPEYRKDLALAYYNMGLILENRGLIRPAEQAYRQAAAHQDKLAQELPEVLVYRQDRARFYTTLGLLLRNHGLPEDADKALRQALAIRKQLAAESPEEPAHASELGAASHNLALLFMKQMQLPQARLLLEEAVAHQQTALKKDPKNPAYLTYLGRHFNALGTILRVSGDLPRAIQCNRQGCEVCESLVNAFRDNPTYRADLGAALNNLAQLLMAQRQWTEARSLLHQAIGHQQAALKPNPDHPTFKGYLRNHYLNLAETELQMRDHAHAAQAAAELPRLAVAGSQDHHNAARLLTACAAAVNKDDKLATEQRQKLAQAYADQAMQYLRAAVQRGLSNSDNLRKDPVLQPLRSRDDFQRLLEAMDSAAAPKQ